MPYGAGTAVERNGVGVVAEPEAAPSNVYATVALVMGIVGVVAAVLLAMIGSVIGAGAVSVGVIARRMPERRGLATAGIVVGVVAVVVGIVNALLNVLVFGGQA